MAQQTPTEQWNTFEIKSIIHNNKSGQCAKMLNAKLIGHLDPFSISLSLSLLCVAQFWLHSGRKPTNTKINGRLQIRKMSVARFVDGTKYCCMKSWLRKHHQSHINMVFSRCVLCVFFVLLYSSGADFLPLFSANELAN